MFGLRDEVRGMRRSIQQQIRMPAPRLPAAVSGTPCMLSNCRPNANLASDATISPAILRRPLRSGPAAS